jgi:SPP1 gp7 family putative phage head morphogenesis protein
MAELFDIVVRRQIYIEGLKAKQGQQWAVALAQLRRELEQRLSLVNVEDLGEMTKTALRELIRDLRAIARRVFDPWLSKLIAWLQEFVAIDAEMLAALYTPYAEDEEAADALQEAASDDLYAGAIAAPLAATGTLALPFLLALLPSTMVRLERLVLQHYAQRSKAAELRKAIVGTAAAKFSDGAIRNIQRQAQAATNTVLQHLANQVNERMGHKIVGFYEWVSVLDDRTTAICRERDGKRYPYMRGPLPPAHINCRSTTVPSPIGAPKTPDGFADWLKTQPFEFIKDALYGQRSARYESTPAIDLRDYVGKRDLIGQP